MFPKFTMETVKVKYLSHAIDTTQRFAHLISQNAANYVSESIKGGANESAKEANKNVAKDSDASLGTRAQAAKDTAINKKDEKVHDTKAETHKGKSLVFTT